MKNLCLFFIIAGLTVQSYAQSITNVNPSQAMQAQQLDVYITGQSTNFTAGTSTYAWFSQGSATYFYAGTVTVMSATSLKAFFGIPAQAPTGNYDVNVVNGSTYLVKPAGFQITANPNPPQITTVLPDTGYIGTTLSVSISGQNTHFNQGTVTAVWFQQGSLTIYPGITSVISNTLLNAQFFLPYALSPGYLDVKAQNSIDGLLVKTNAFYVQNSTVGLLPLKPENIIRIYPNPAETEIFLDVPNTLKGPTEIVIYDNAGIPLETHFMNSPGTGLIDISGLSPGLYLLRIRSGNYTGAFKIIRK